MIKRTIVWMLVAVMLISMAACNTKKDTTKYRLQIVASIFPYYDIAKHLTENVGGINVEMAVSPGLDSHTFEPTPKDIQKIEAADIFIYNGGTMETWVENVLKSVNRDKKPNLCMMDCLNHEQILEVDEREELYGEMHEEEEEESEEELDEHIWTSPLLMIQMTDIILDKLCKLDTENQNIYRENAKAYKEQLQKLDLDFRNVVNSAEKKEIIFADKFPLLYFTREYGLTHYAAFPGCSSDMEPSAKTVAFLEDKINEEKVGAVFYLELNSGKVAETIKEDTGVKALRFYSCHNVTGKQFEDDVTYYEMMCENVKNLSVALR